MRPTSEASGGGRVYERDDHTKTITSRTFSTLRHGRRLLSPYIYSLSLPRTIFSLLLSASANMSDSESSSPPPPRPRTLSMLLPFLSGVARSTTGSQLNQIVVLDHAARTVVVFEGHVLDSLLRELSEKSGPLPASKPSIDAMPRVGVTEVGIDCAICLEGFEVGEAAREMPCKHRYHSDCIEKWLGVHGTCPVCRFAMPVDDQEGKKSGGDDEDMEGREGRVVVVNLWISDGETMDVESGSGHGSGDYDSESQDGMIIAVDDSSTQDPSPEDSS